MTTSGMRARPAGGELGDELGDGVGGKKGEEGVEVDAIAELGVGDVVGKREEKQRQGHEAGEGAHPVAVEEEKAGEPEQGGEESVELIDGRADRTAGSRPRSGRCGGG